MNFCIRLSCCVNRVISGNPQFCCESVTDLLEESGQQSADISLFPRLALCPPSSDALLLNPAVCAQCEDALDQVRVASAKNESCIIIGLVKRFGGKPVDVIAVLQNGEIAAYLPAAGYGRLQSADPVTGYYREQERPGSPLRGWDTLFGCGELRFCVCPCPVSDLPLHLPRLVRTGCQAVLVPCYEPATAESAEKELRLVRALSESFGIAIAFVRGGQGDTSHPVAFQGHAAICECGEMLAQYTGRALWAITPLQLESFSFARDLDCDILRACQRFSSDCQPEITFRESSGKKGLLREIRKDPFLPAGRGAGQPLPADAVRAAGAEPGLPRGQHRPASSGAGRLRRAGLHPGARSPRGR